MSNPQRPDVSICVVTYRRPAGLARLLASVDRLKRPEGLGLEVIVVDNDPDAPPPPCRPDADPPLRWLRQGRTALARARARAAAEARGEWVAFVDDDELLHEAWLAAYWEQAQRGRSAGLFGGASFT